MNRVYSLETTKKYFLKTIAYSVESSEIFMIFLEVFYKARTSFVVFGYFKKMNIILNNRYYHDKSFILKIILNIRCSLNFIFFVYQFVYLKNNSDYMTLMLYCLVDLSVFLLDFINLTSTIFQEKVFNSGYKPINNLFEKQEINNRAK